MIEMETRKKQEDAWHVFVTFCLRSNLWKGKKIRQEDRHMWLLRQPQKTLERKQRQGKKMQTNTTTTQQRNTWLSLFSPPSFEIFTHESCTWTVQETVHDEETTKRSALCMMERGSCQQHEERVEMESETETEKEGWRWGRKFTHTKHVSLFLSLIFRRLFRHFSLNSLLELQKDRTSHSYEYSYRLPFFKVDEMWTKSSSSLPMSTRDNIKQQPKHSTLIFEKNVWLVFERRRWTLSLRWMSWDGWQRRKRKSSQTLLTERTRVWQKGTESGTRLTRVRPFSLSTHLAFYVRKPSGNNPTVETTTPIERK